MMSKYSKFEWRIFALVSLPAVVAIVAVVCAPIPWLIANVIPDDSFYYFKIARNIVAGAGSAFDGVEITNGYHPLWMVILLPLYALFDDVMAMRAALLLCGALYVGSGFVLLNVAKRWGLSLVARGYGLLFWLYNPFLFFEMLNGLETALATFLLLSAFSVLDAQGTQRKGVVYAGLLMGAAVLARLDFAIYAAIFFVWYAVHPGLSRSIRLQLISVYSFCVAVFFVPWFVFNYAAYGMFATSASSINPMVTRELILSDNGFSSFALVKGTISSLYDQSEYVIRSLGAFEFVFIALGMVITARLFSLQAALARRGTGIFLAAGFIAYFLVNVGIRLTGRTWYFVLISVFGAFLVAECVDVVRVRIAPGRARDIVLGGIFLAVVGSFFFRYQSDVAGRNQQQIKMYESALWLESNLEAGSHVAVFNSGIVGYFAPHVRIINIDGLVNNSARDAMEERVLWDYVVREADYFADMDLYLSYRYYRFLGVEDPFADLHAIATIGETSNRGNLNVYEIRK